MKTPTAVKTLARAIEFLRDELGDVPLQALSVYLVVAERGEIPHLHLQKIVGISQASISRNLMLLSRVDRRGNEGLDLVESYTDPQEHRRKLAKLTKKGEELIKELDAKLS